MAARREFEPEGIFDRLVRGFGGAVADIHQKLIMEGWFGRSVMTPDAAPNIEPGSRSAFPDLAHPSFEKDWAARPRSEGKPEREAGHIQEPEIDR